MTHCMTPVTMLAGIAAVTAAITITVSLPAGARDYPNRPIRMVAPLAPGGGNDIPARIPAKDMGQKSGQPVPSAARRTMH